MLARFHAKAHFSISRHSSLTLIHSCSHGFVTHSSLCVSLLYLWGSSFAILHTLNAAVSAQLFCSDATHARHLVSPFPTVNSHIVESLFYSHHCFSPLPLLVSLLPPSAFVWILGSASYRFHLLCFNILPFSTSSLTSCIMDRSPEMPGAQAKRGQKARAGHNTYDGPGDSESRGRSTSNAGSRARSQSRTASQIRAAQMETARSMQQPEARVQQLLRNVEFGGNAYNIFSSVSCGFSSPCRAIHELASHAPIPCNSLFVSHCHRIATW